MSFLNRDYLKYPSVLLYPYLAVDYRMIRYSPSLSCLYSWGNSSYGKGLRDSLRIEKFNIKDVTSVTGPYPYMTT
jgi:hypothetical protein